jgi:hypothetical protein
MDLLLSQKKPAKIRYSPLEQRILDFIPEDGSHINTLELVSMVYNAGEAPRNARQSVLHTANCLIAKSDENEEPWEIFKSTSKPAYFWRLKRGEGK